jgi:hypothetical protein
MSTGHKTWIIAGGHIPLRSTGDEPEFSSRDELCVLNTNAKPAKIAIMVYHEANPPAGPYKIELKEECVRHIRFNDLVDPLPISLDTGFAAVVTSDVPIVVQFTRMDTSHKMVAGFSTLAFSADT